MLHKTDQKSSWENEESASRRHLPVLSPWLFFLFFTVSAIICFLFSFTVLIVSLLHCEHLAIGVHLLEGGGAEQMSIGFDIWESLIMVFVRSALVQDGLSSRYHTNNSNMNHFRHFT